jgi:hypothetical protein
MMTDHKIWWPQSNYEKKLDTDSFVWYETPIVSEPEKIPKNKLRTCRIDLSDGVDFK